MGGPFGAMIAYQCPDIQVTVVDTNAQRVDAWNSGHPPMYEPGLEDILATIRRRGCAVTKNSCCNLQFSIEIEQAIKDADMIFLCIDTPTKTFGIGQDAAPDLSNLQAAIRTIARVASTDKIVVEKSTVPCGTAELIRDLVCISSAMSTRNNANETEREYSCTGAARQTSKYYRIPNSCQKARQSMTSNIPHGYSSDRNRQLRGTRPQRNSHSYTRHGYHRS